MACLLRCLPLCSKSEVNLRSRLVTTHLRRKSILPTNLGWKIPAERNASASTSAAMPVSQGAEREPATGETTARATSQRMANVPHAGSVSCAHTAQRDFSSAESCCPLEIQPISQTTQPTGLYLCVFECSSKKRLMIVELSPSQIAIERKNNKYRHCDMAPAHGFQSHAVLTWPSCLWSGAMSPGCLPARES